MGRNGSFEYKEFEQFKNKISKLTEQQVQEFIIACAKELAARLLSKTIKRTPVGQYPSSSGKVGGTLRRGWTTGKSASAYVDSLDIKLSNGVYTIEIVNPVDYASYVEFGHRTRNGEGWVEGKFMLTISEQEIQAASPKILENKINKMLGECFK